MSEIGDLKIDYDIFYRWIDAVLARFGPQGVFKETFWALKQVRHSHYFAVTHQDKTPQQFTHLQMHIGKAICSLKVAH